MQPPAPVAREPVVATGQPAAPSEHEQFFAPAVLQPVTVHAPAPPPRTGSNGGRWLTVVGIVVFVAAASVSAWFSFGPGKGTKKQAQQPVALAPQAATNAIPSSLSAVVRIQAESARRNAVQAVASVGSGDLAALREAQPALTWVEGAAPSTGPHEVSVATDTTGVVTIAVAATNHDVCAFGRWSPDGIPTYVTVAHQPACSAANAPGAGWSTEGGGAISDLPDENG